MRSNRPLTFAAPGMGLGLVSTRMYSGLKARPLSPIGDATPRPTILRRGALSKRWSISGPLVA